MAYKGSDKQKATDRAWRAKNKERVASIAKKSNAKCKERISAYQKDYREKNKKKLSIYHKEWRRKNLSNTRVYMRARRKNNINFRLREALRTRQTKALNGLYKKGSFVRDLGCTISELKFYLEGQFLPGMSWENYGEWHIDHIIPLSFFDLTDREQFLKACHYSNLQPLWAKENLVKANKIISRVNM